MERCVHKHLTKYFTENNVISPYQSGFVSGDSTINQLNSTTLASFKRTLSTPSTVPQHFYTIQTSRIGQILHTRLRLECSSLNQHLYKKNLINSPNCTCGQVESVAHFFLFCPRYAQIRQRYFGNVTFPVTVNTLLYGLTDQNRTNNDSIFKQVQLYIIASKRFT